MMANVAAIAADIHFTGTLQDEVFEERPLMLIGIGRQRY
jgi:hypothetical protein